MKVLIPREGREIDSLIKELEGYQRTCHMSVEPTEQQLLERGYRPFEICNNGLISRRCSNRRGLNPAPGRKARKVWSERSREMSKRVNDQLSLLSEPVLRPSKECRGLIRTCGEG